MGGRFREIARRHQPIFPGLLAIPRVFSEITVVAPLWNTHAGMTVRKAIILRSLDELAGFVDKRYKNCWSTPMTWATEAGRLKVSMSCRPASNRSNDL